MQLSVIKYMEALAREKNEIISLSQGIPYSPSDTRIRNAVYAAIKHNQVDSYSDPQGMYALRSEISDSLKVCNMSYGADELLVTAGAVEGMLSTLLALSQRGDEVIIPTPTYPAFFSAAEVAGLTIKPVQLQEDNEWSLDLEAVRKQVTSHTKFLIICNPNNPTGSIYKQKLLESLGDLALEKGFMIIMDEVYSRMLYGDHAWYSLAMNPKYTSCIIRLESFSKNFSLTGWRVGFIQANQDVIKKILPVHDTVVNCTPVVSQYAALAALKYGQEIITQKMAVYTLHRQIMGKYLSQVGDFLSFSYPNAGYFFFPKLTGDRKAVDFCYQLLEKAKVSVVPGDGFGLGGEQHIRLCFGRNRESIEEGMRRIVVYTQSL